MFERRSIVPRLNRTVLPDDYVMVTDLWGGKTLATKVCKSCGKDRHINDFYLESKSKRKTKYQTRDVCIPCWDIGKGKRLG